MPTRLHGGYTSTCWFHARAVLEMVDEATTGGTLEKVRQQLPDDYDRLFEAGTTGKMV